jgi:hypothetical protein
MSSVENTESVQTPSKEETNIKSNEQPSLEETITEVPPTEKPIIIRKSLLQILIGLFLGCTSKSSVSHVINPAVEIVEELSNVTIEVIIEESKEIKE